MSNDKSVEFPHKQTNESLKEVILRRQTQTLGQFQEHEPFSFDLLLIGNVFRLLERFCEAH